MTQRQATTQARVYFDVAPRLQDDISGERFQRLITDRVIRCRRPVGKQDRAIGHLSIFSARMRILNDDVPRIEQDRSRLPCRSTDVYAAVEVQNFFS